MSDSANGPDATDIHDGLVKPYDLTAGYGEGVSRAVVLGGGGIFFIAWQVAYLRELKRRGVDLAGAERIVGTSAGSVVAALLAGGRIDRAAAEVSMLARVPGVVGAMAPAGDLAPSQQRALDLFSSATDSRPDTIRRIGHAALAADAAKPSKIRRSVAGILAMRKWPARSLHAMTVDTYSGERLAVTGSAQVPVSAAAAASSSVPGLFQPQPILDRRCMDGGVSGSGTHGDMAVGARSVVLLSLALPSEDAVARMTIQPNTVVREVDAIRNAGGRVILRGPEQFDLDTLMNPASMPDAVAMGQRQAAADADAIGAIWQ